MRIRVNLLSEDSVREAIKQIRYYRKEVQRRANEVVSVLARMGTEIVDTQFSIVNEHDPPEVYCLVNGNSAMIIAEGDNVVFLEFGTGVDVTDKTQELGMETEGLPPIYAGSWSETMGRGTFARYGWWHYKGQLYTGTMATQGFYFASKEIREKAVEEAKRIFRK